MRPADVLKVMTVSDAQISPNGQWVVYSVSSVDEDQNVSTLWLARVTFESSAGSGADTNPAAPTAARLLQRLAGKSHRASATTALGLECINSTLVSRQ
jgi:hypothetical protein